MEHFKGNFWSFQQDWASAPGAKSNLEFIEKNFPNSWGKDIWPSNSSDLNPLDHSICFLLKDKACKKRHASIQSLK